MPRGSDGSIAGALRDLIADVRLLIRQQLVLARAEIREELQRARIVLMLAVATAGLLGAAGLWMLVAITRGVADLFDWPIWAGYAFVGVLLGLAGAVLSVILRQQMREVAVLPKSQETLTEHVHWLGARVAPERAETE